ncbi:DUF2935 domain-containing protein [Clostridium celatum]|uniref:DUF2935 domain-containing protein n=1 Tax=Clostridium celatum TaxID=36834 RepID=UPI0028FEA90A|nr:DUF2935 domain-containing protein [Clostridium celatum]MDU2264922.1 DUF2935 domain-containing protein [Clostridium celatum]MDU6294516.1 DUF2935 domain-containing protein [Clostridium celatum]
MISKEKYVVSSLELHLFFGRIMKEHSLFLEAGFTSKNTKLSKEADNYKISFEKLLLDTLRVSNERIRKSILDSGEIFTDFTLNAEKKTSYYTGIGINSKITLMEKELKCNSTSNIDTKVVNCVKSINNRAIKLLDGLIEFKIKILDEMLCCKLFTGNYPLLIEHIIREAKLYRLYIKKIENNENIDNDDIKKTELFWNQIMMEHSLFIRGLFDPGEDELINTSNKFAGEFGELIKKADSMTEMTMASVTNEILTETIKLRDFKKAGAKGIIDCEIKSIILPLLADHVLREANHYIRLLRSYEK